MLQIMGVADTGVSTQQNFRHSLLFSLTQIHGLQFYFPLLMRSIYRSGARITSCVAVAPGNVILPVPVT